MYFPHNCITFDAIMRKDNNQGSMGEGLDGERVITGEENSYYWG